MQTSKNYRTRQALARAWALLDRAEHRVQQSIQAEAGPSLWLIAANSILHARDVSEAIHPAAPHAAGVEALPDGTCQDPRGPTAYEDPSRSRTRGAVCGIGTPGRGRTRSWRAVPAVNAPTVRELLRDASSEACSIMWETTALDGPGLAAAWPAFAAQARDALATVPLSDPETRLLIVGDEDPRSRPNRWGPPIGTEPGPHLIRAGQALADIADLLKRHATRSEE